MENPEYFFPSPYDPMMHPEDRRRSILFLGVGLHSLIALANLYMDYPGLCGKFGLIPDEPRLEKIVNEFEYSSLLAFFPSLQYFISAEYLMLIGIWASLLMVFVGNKRPRLTRVASFVVYLVLLSFSGSMGVLLWFPWDCLLFELLIITAVCPDTAWVFELLLFRVMFGFGKHKFLGATEWADLTYTASMACWQPLGSSIGWLLSFAPDWVHVMSIMITFAIEMICPFFILWGSQWQKKISSWCTIVLMTAIQVSGHFGWFNTLTSLLAGTVLADSERVGKKHSFSMGKKSFATAYIMMSIIFLIPSQWNSPSLFYQHTFDHPGWDIVRAASSWRVLHSYGVFPPKKMPMIKPVSRWEVDFEDGATIQMGYYYQHSGPTASTGYLPLLVAPLRFPRFDYIVGFYAASHVWSLATRLGPAWGSGEEYVDAVAHMLLHHPERLGMFFRPIDVVSSLPVRARVIVVGLVPDWEKGWIEISSEVDREWDTSHKHSDGGPIAHTLSPSMIALRRKSKSFKNVQNGLHTNFESQDLFDLAVILVDISDMARASESVWLDQVESEYQSLAGTALICGESHCLWNIAYSTEFGGYIGCLTFLHLIPPPFHSPLCSRIMQENAIRRDSSGKHSKIPIEDYIAWMTVLHFS